MKNVITIFGGLILVSFILFICNNNSNDKKEVSPINEVPKTAMASSEDKSAPEVTAAPSPPNLTLVKARTNGDKYVDWGSKPIEPEDGPVDPWTMPFMMCQGPPFMDGQIKASSTRLPREE